LTITEVSQDIGVTHQTLENEEQIVKQQAIKQVRKVETNLILGKEILFLLLFF